ncbi:MAG: ABC transporter ATP-binding protein, partial [Bacteroidales bacterium]|nr:ABC transporter ATP-binding protein [Bacteroidales bacterium]
MSEIKENNLLLEVKDLCVSFKRDKTWTEVLHGVSFSINKGEVLGLVGESGSGKSVSSLAIMGLLDKKIAKITKGEIIFHQNNGEKTLHLEDFEEKDFQKLRGKHIAMIFQEPMTALNPVKKCGPQVDEMILTHFNISKQEAKKKTLELFKEVLLPDIERAYNAYPHELSGGQRQRIMIAMAISCEPEMLIADEPTTALDVTVQKTILSLISSLQNKHNMSVLFISHDLGVVKNMCNKAVVIYRGKIIEQNSIENIFNNAQEPYTKGLIASRPPLDYKPERLLTINDFMNNEKIEINKISPLQQEQIRQKIYENTPILTVDGLNIEYILKKNIFGKASKKFHAIKDVSFEVYKGETLGLVGESGCGKTTIGRAIMQLIETKSGNISFKGMNLKTMTAKQRHEIRKKIQIVFQDPYSSLNPRKTIGATIEEPMEVFNLLDNG